ncbi:hypothetical protein [Hoyosella altamirensis]|uniref:Uncharacterized protein (DUF2384 family) n=1 Tax=Hoyosella altamirensis TaxID=616997 RepID=A0A839RIP9_9ACTN|nr:hypothetical protein [Hoyosella altamirensis]MBB3035911.1 uncharacterized protein (DUF2384 family) [Hoyosella altamirensis]
MDAKSGKAAKRVPASHADPLARERTQFLVDRFGSRGLARMIGVSPSQPTRWAQGKEHPGPDSATLLIDLEHILARARLVWGEPTAIDWFSGHNAYLQGARPIDVLKLRGPAPVLDALHAEMWGGAA